LIAMPAETKDDRAPPCRNDGVHTKVNTAISVFYMNQDVSVEVAVENCT
jgi:hypothetical protein